MNTRPVHITFIHGLANKPSPRDLRRIWLEAMSKPVNGDAGFDPEAEGVTVSFVYWADLFYDQPLPASGYESAPNEMSDEVKQDMYLPDDYWIAAMRQYFPDDVTNYPDPPKDDSIEGFERIPLPDIVKRDIMKHFLREAHDYLFNVNGIRDTIRKRVLTSMSEGVAGARHVLVGHSQGSIIAYDVLTGVPGCLVVEGLLTLGSPLGIDEVQDQLAWTRENGFPKKLKGDWINVFDPYDLVSRLDPYFANDFRKDSKEVVIDVKEENWGSWRHSATKYLQGPLLRKHLRHLCGRENS